MSVICLLVSVMARVSLLTEHNRIPLVTCLPSALT